MPRIDQVAKYEVHISISLLFNFQLKSLVGQTGFEKNPRESPSLNSNRIHHITYRANNNTQFNFSVVSPLS